VQHEEVAPCHISSWCSSSNKITIKQEEAEVDKKITVAIAYRANMDYDRVIEECPELKRWQFAVAALLWLPTLSGGLNIMSYTFAGYAPPHRCVLPCEDNTTNTQQTPDWFQAVAEDDLDKECKFYEFKNDSMIDGGCEADMFDKSNIVPCENYVWDRSVFHETLVTEFNLVCSQKWKKGFIGVMYMIGLFIGSYIIGFISDRFGRKIAMMGSLVLLALGGALAGIMPYYSLYVCCYVVAAIAGYGTYVAPFLMTVEIMGNDKKTLLSMMVNFPFVIGEALMCLIAWSTSSYGYRAMHLVGYIPLLAMLPLWFILPESPRWLLAKGRVEEARNVIKYGTKLTGVKISDEVLIDSTSPSRTKHIEAESDNLVQKDEPAQDEAKDEVSFFDIVKSKTLLPRLLANYINWAVITLCYYGLTMNSVNLAGDIFVNTLLGVLIEAPGYLIALLTMDRFGRKPILVLCQLVAGCACIGAGFVPTSIPVLMSVLSCVGKMGSSAAFSLIYLYSAEMFPTAVRNTALGTCSMVARVGGFMAPYIASLGSSEDSTYVPFLIFGISTLVGGSTAILLPETLGTQLPVTIEDAEKLCTEKKNKTLCKCC